MLMEKAGAFFDLPQLEPSNLRIVWYYLYSIWYRVILLTLLKSFVERKTGSTLRSDVHLEPQVLSNSNVLILIGCQPRRPPRWQYATQKNRKQYSRLDGYVQVRMCWLFLSSIPSTVRELHTREECTCWTIGTGPFLSIYNISSV